MQSEVEVWLRDSIDAASSAIVSYRKGELDDACGHVEEARGLLRRALERMYETPNESEGTDG
jgi:HEPN domain-containing protein